MGYTITGKEKLKHIEKALEEKDRKIRIADVGGNKHGLVFFKSLGFEKIIAINNSEKELEGCPKDNSVLLDITEPLPARMKGKFDVVIAMDLIEHLVIPDQAIVNLNQMLKDRGVLILTTPNLANLFNRLFLLIGWSPTNYHASTIKTGNPLTKARIGACFRNSFPHKSVFTSKQLKELIEIYGFRVTKHKGYDYSSDNPSKSGGNYSLFRKTINRLLPTSMKEGIFLVCEKRELVGVEEIKERFS